MKKGRSVFLFGAGSTLAWGSPSTNELTDLVRKSGFKLTDNKTTITEFIFQQLSENSFKNEDINFETIISVIEELIVYYSNFDREKKLPSLLSPFLSSKFEEIIFNFSISGGEASHGYKLQIPKNKDYPYSENSYNNETPYQFFLIQLLKEILTDIGAGISKYAYNTTSHSVIDLNSTVSEYFSEWMKSQSESNILRLYTLNYDRVFKILLKKKGLDLFEGFDIEENAKGKEYIRANVPKIMTDLGNNIHYNLHGSIYWEVWNQDMHQLFNPEIVLTPIPSLSINSNSASFQIEKGKSLLLTNIITGYQKIQKSNFSPFRQFQSMFDYDCCFANEIYIIGYSFGDEHVNQVMKTAIRYNQTVKITIIDPCFFEATKAENFAINFLSFRENDNVTLIKDSENSHKTEAGNFTIHTLTFEDFLQKHSTNNC